MRRKAQAGGDRREAEAGRRAVVAGPAGGGSDPLDRRDAVHVLPVAQGVWRAEVGPGEAAEGPREGERAAAEGGLGSDAGEADPARGRLGKLLSPARRRRCIDHVMREVRRVRAAGVPRAGAASLDTKKVARTPDDEAL